MQTYRSYSRCSVLMSALCAFSLFGCNKQNTAVHQPTSLPTAPALMPTHTQTPTLTPRQSKPAHPILSVEDVIEIRQLAKAFEPFAQATAKIEARLGSADFTGTRGSYWYITTKDGLCCELKLENSDQQLLSAQHLCVGKNTEIYQKCSPP